MSYKHNNLMAMRLRYWQENSASVQQDKQDLKKFLIAQQLFADVSEQDLHYFFFSLPSQIIIKAHALGFSHHHVVQMMQSYVADHQIQLKNKQSMKIKYRN
ncbi:hypothetical protein [Acinetobacter sp. MD2(2019)]|uniref:hypothetical protein n=1 Tax=Acinetobacter sp. MD2(2019) TaxID=2605273 RepID=UPI002D1E76FB|nr:hypothetical protein [Acinetobacter sp. MD2(2019)]MEB3753857.1 hypothetical protein [Acinetobacter sp. MD2(2019)]